MPRTSILRALAPALLAGLAASSCGTTGGRAWGADATLLPSRERLAAGAKGALADPWTWAPLAAAGVLAIDDWDERVGAWAFEEHPVFGSVETAEDWSDLLRDALQYTALATSLAAESGEDPGSWTWSKAKGVGLQLGASKLTDEVTGYLKDATERTRPNGANQRSLPSRHTSLSASHRVWASRNLDWIPATEGWRTPLRAGLGGMVAATAWARVESGNHHPTDVLVGAALGNALTRFVHEALLGPAPDFDVVVEAAPGGDGVAVGLSWSPRPAGDRPVR